ncbi:MAG: phthalate 4,5-dioxygenase [Chloroflexota bacterium]|nr:phthalate 4,5-dioxygenase [Chloroflexota bacterium]
MLTREENEQLTGVGPGTPMGEVLRRYWIPIVISDEVAEPGCDPVRVKLLGEELIAFRDRTGRVGLIDEFCPHRGASLYYAQVADCGLQCVYHGWKFDATGTTLETPNESGVRMWEGKKLIAAYPTHEACGVVWAYMGPPDRMPAFPNFPWNVKQHVHAKKVLLECNYLQSIEGGIDSSHLSWLHQSNVNLRPDNLATRDQAPRIEFQDMPYGFRYGAIRNAGDGDQYVRITPFIMPWYTIVPFVADQTQAAHAWVPIDDEHNWAFTFNWTHADEPLPPEKWTHPYDLVDRFHKQRTRENRHLQDREVMRNGDWTGIPSIPDQDAGIQESMKPIFDRSREHLGGADLAIIHARAQMLASIKALAEGRDPVGIGMDFPADQIQCVVQVVPGDTPWRELGLPTGVAAPA